MVLWWVHGRTCMFQFTQGKIEMMDGFGKHCSPVTLRTSCVFICTTSRFPFPNGGTSLRTNKVLFICPEVPRWLSLFPNPNYSLCDDLFDIVWNILARIITKIQNILLSTLLHVKLNLPYGYNAAVNDHLVVLLL